LNDWLNGLPDPRVQELCVYAAARLWWHIIATFLSRNGFDEQRQSGEAAWNLGALCGQTSEDPRFQGEFTVTCSDNAALHASRAEPELVAQIRFGFTQSSRAESSQPDPAANLISEVRHTLHGAAHPARHHPSLVTSPPLCDARNWERGCSEAPANHTNSCRCPHPAAN